MTSSNTVNLNIPAQICFYSIPYLYFSYILEHFFPIQIMKLLMVLLPTLITPTECISLQGIMDRQFKNSTTAAISYGSSVTKCNSNLRGCLCHLAAFSVTCCIILDAIVSVLKYCYLE